MMEPVSLLLFVPTYTAIALSPGLCMMLALSLGMSLGVRRVVWLMVGELAGVMLVGLASMAAIFAATTAFPLVLVLLRYVGGGYLLYVAASMIRAGLALPVAGSAGVGVISRRGLMGRGFSTAVTNPKGWVFLISFLPPFLNLARPMFPQAGILLAMMLVIEALSLVAYASAGAMMGRLTGWGDGARWGRIVPGVLIGVLGVLLLAGVI
ncbi:MAG: LysE family translocator [Acidiphilium sp.]